MKSWKEESLLNEGFKTRRTPSGYKPTIGDRSEMRMNATSLSKMLYELCDIAGGKSNKNFEEVKDLFEGTLDMFYDMLDDVRR